MIIRIVEGTQGIQGTVSGTDQTVAALTNADDHTSHNVLRVWVENQGSGEYVEKSGDTMTGTLIVPDITAVSGTFTDSLFIGGLLSKYNAGLYNDGIYNLGARSTLDNTSISTESGIFSTSLTISGTPVATGTSFVPGDYVAKSGDTMTGDLWIDSADLTVSGGVKFVDSAGGGFQFLDYGGLGHPSISWFQQGGDSPKWQMQAADVDPPVWVLWDRGNGGAEHRGNRIVVASGSPGLLQRTSANFTIGQSGNVWILPPTSEGVAPDGHEALHVTGSGLFEGGLVATETVSGTDFYTANITSTGTVTAPTGTFAESLTISGTPIDLTAISNVVEDTTPQLGGNLDVNGQQIVSVGGGDINIVSDDDISIYTLAANGDATLGAYGTDGQVIITAGGAGGDVLVAAVEGVVIGGQVATVIASPTTIVTGSLTVGAEPGASLVVSGTVSGTEFYTGAITATDTLNVPYYASNAIPSITFGDDPDTGIGRRGENNMVIIANGVQSCRFTHNHVFADVPFLNNNGSISEPTYGFINDQDTGMYLKENLSGNLGFTCSGTEIVAMSGTGNTTDGMGVLGNLTVTGTVGADTGTFDDSLTISGTPVASGTSIYEGADGLQYAWDSTRQKNLSVSRQTLQFGRNLATEWFGWAVLNPAGGAVVGFDVLPSALPRAATITSITAGGATVSGEPYVRVENLNYYPEVKVNDALIEIILEGPRDGSKESRVVAISGGLNIDVDYGYGLQCTCLTENSMTDGGQMADPICSIELAWRDS